MTNLLPVTYACPADEGWDPVLALLERGRKSVADAWTWRRYVDPDGPTCAIGAIAKADGFTFWDFVDRGPYVVCSRLSGPARKAVEALDHAAAKLYPRVPQGRWINRVEAVNQRLGRKAVLRLYDYAIAMLSGEVPATKRGRRLGARLGFEDKGKRVRIVRDEPVVVPDPEPVEAPVSTPELAPEPVPA